MGYLTLSERKVVEEAEAYNALSVEVRDALEKKYPRRNTSQKQRLNSSRLCDVIEQAKELATSFKQDPDDVSIEHETEYDYDSESVSVYLFIEAPETDAQYHKRLMESYKWDLSREEQDRKEFERLKAKFK